MATLPWAKTRSALDATTFGAGAVCWSPDLGIFVAASQENDGNIVWSSDGLTWTLASSVPAGFGVTDFCWSPELGIFVGSGGLGGFSPGEPASIYSSDGDVWIASTPITLPPGATDVAGTAVAWSSAQNKFVMGIIDIGVVTGPSFATSTNGIVWTKHNSGFDSGQVWAIAYSPDLDLWCAVGVTDPANKPVATSADGASWTLHSVGAHQVAYTIIWSDRLGKFVAVAPTGDQILTSSDGSAWSEFAISQGGGSFSPGGSGAIAESADLFVVAGGNAGQTTILINAADPEADDWDSDASSLSTSGLSSGSRAAYSPSLDVWVATGAYYAPADARLTAILSTASASGPPTPVFGGTRFYEAPPWRLIVGDLEDNTLTFLDRLALDRSITVTRAAARIISGRVPSDNPEVNIPAPMPDNEPFVSEGVRLVSCFRREAPAGSNEKPWVIRARGIVLSLEDDADSDHATSTFTAYDPWKYWYRRPVLRDDGTIGDVSYVAGTSANEIIVDQFGLAIAFGDTLFTDFGQTGFYTGVIEGCAPLPDGGDGLAMTFRSGTTLGEMCDLLVATGTCDIVNDPIYDIANRPGLLTQTSVYRVAGQFQGDAIFAWDRWPGSLVQLSRQVEGTERANSVQMYAGQGGPPVPLETDAASLARFGEYWALQYLPGVPSLAGAHTIAQRQLALLKDGQYTYALSPASERAPLLFQEYREADTLPVYASKRFRDPISGVPVRVESIPIVVGDDELERVNQMLVSFAPESGS